jgi:predicted SAM-dependent methyltransferase
MKLNLGCGQDIRPVADGWVNVDMFPGPGVNMVMDISKPLPFETGSADHVRVSHILEHILAWESTLEEIYRVLKPGGTVEVRVPYGWAGIQSAYHYRLFAEHTLDSFIVEECSKDQWFSYQCKESRKFHRVEQYKVYHMPFAWHIEKYLKIKAAKWPIGSAHEMVWVLQKPNGIKARE